MGEEEIGYGGQTVSCLVTRMAATLSIWHPVSETVYRKSM